MVAFLQGKEAEESISDEYEPALSIPFMIVTITLSSSNSLMSCVLERKEGAFHRKKSRSQDSFADSLDAKTTKEMLDIKKEVYQKMGLAVPPGPRPGL